MSTFSKLSLLPGHDARSTSTLPRILPGFANLLGLVASVVLWNGLCGQAHAGNWKVVFTGSYDHSITYGNGATNTYKGDLGANDTIDGTNAGTYSVSFDTYAGPEDAQAKASASLHAYLEWHPDFTGDNPPSRVWILDFTEATNDIFLLFDPQFYPEIDLTQYLQSASVLADDGAKSSAHKTISPEIPDALGGLKVKYLHNFSGTTKLYVRENKLLATKIDLGTVSPIAQVRFAAPDEPVPAIPDEPVPAISNTVHALICRSIVVANVSLQVRRKGTGDFGTTTTIAAGGNDSDEHKAEVQLSLSPASENVDLSAVELYIAGGDGVAVDATFTPTPLPPGTTALLTNDQGQAILGTLTSRDLLPQPVTLQIKMANLEANNGDPSATVAHVWDQHGEWKGGDGTGDLPSQIVYNVPTPLSFKPKFDVPITTHTITFKVTGVTVAEFNPASGTYSTKTYKSAVPGQLVLDPQASGYKSDLSDYASFSPASSGDTGSPGIYKTSLTIPYNKDKVVQSVSFVAIDNGVYRYAAIP